MQTIQLATVLQFSISHQIMREGVLDRDSHGEGIGR